MSSLGTVNKEDSTKDSGLFQQPLPASASSNAILLDIFGASRTISISGVFVGSAAEIADFIDNGVNSGLDRLVSGAQSNRVFHSDKSGRDYNVRVSSVTWTSEEGAVSKVDFTINMTEGRA